MARQAAAFLNGLWEPKNCFIVYMFDDTPMTIDFPGLHTVFLSVFDIHTYTQLLIFNIPFQHGENSMVLRMVSYSSDRV